MAGRRSQHGEALALSQPGEGKGRTGELRCPEHRVTRYVGERADGIDREAGGMREVRPGGRGLLTAVGLGSCARVPCAATPGRAECILHRWTGTLAVAAQRPFAYSLLELPLAAADECDGTEPPLGDLLADARDTEPVPASRLPTPC